MFVIVSASSVIKLNKLTVHYCFQTKMNPPAAEPETNCESVEEKAAVKQPTLKPGLTSYIRWVNISQTVFCFKSSNYIEALD